MEGLLWALYIVPIYTDTHGFRIGMSRGAGGRVCSWDLLWRILSLLQGLGSGLGSPLL